MNQFFNTGIIHSWLPYIYQEAAISVFFSRETGEQVSKRVFVTHSKVGSPENWISTCQTDEKFLKLGMWLLVFLQVNSDKLFVQRNNIRSEKFRSNLKWNYPNLFCENHVNLCKHKRENGKSIIYLWWRSHEHLCSVENLWQSSMEIF